MMLLPHFDYERPDSLDQALALLDEHGDKAKVLAGGTDLLIKLQSRALAAERLVSLNGIAELQGIAPAADGGLAIGGGVRLAEIARHPQVRGRYPALVRACTVMATPQIRNMGTVAGNLVNASPCADTAGPLLIYDASIELAQRNGSRKVPLAQFFTGPKSSDCRVGEIAVRIHLPAPPARCGAAYSRISGRSRVDISAASVAGLVALDAGGRVEVARLAVGAVAPTPLRCTDAEGILAGQVPDEVLIEKAAEACADAARPIDDVRAVAGWRLVAVRVMAGRILRECIAAARGAEESR